MRNVTIKGTASLTLGSWPNLVGLRESPKRQGRIRLADRLLAAGFLVRTLTLAMLALLVSGIAHVVAQPARAQSVEMSELVTKLIDRRAEYEDLPDEFQRQTGYVPIVRSGVLIDPNGSCSSPVPFGPEMFTDACRAHDLGYDVLRAAAEDGSSLGAWARFELDARLYSDLLEMCSDARCRATATVFYGAVTFNSIRQGYRAPAEEPALPWAGLSVAVPAAALLVRPKRSYTPDPAD